MGLGKTKKRIGGGHKLRVWVSDNRPHEECYSNDCTVVIITFNRRATLDATLGRMTALPENPRVIVVDNGSTDGTLTHLTTVWPLVLAVGLNKNIGAAARNIGARFSNTRYIAFCDDDTWWDAGSLLRGIEILDANTTVGIINAKIIVEPEGELDSACAEMARAAPSKGSIGVPIVYFLACAIMVRRSTFLAAGGYHPRFHIGAEEALLALDVADAGWQIWYCPQLVLHHAPCKTGRLINEREQLVARNRLWTVWLRHTARRAFAQTLVALKDARTDPIARQAFLRALAGLPWILLQRRAMTWRLQATVDALGLRSNCPTSARVSSVAT